MNVFRLIGPPIACALALACGDAGNASENEGSSVADTATTRDASESASGEAENDAGTETSTETDSTGEPGFCPGIEPNDGVSYCSSDDPCVPGTCGRPGGGSGCSLFPLANEESCHHECEANADCGPGFACETTEAKCGCDLDTSSATEHTNCVEACTPDSCGNQEVCGANGMDGLCVYVACTDGFTCPEGQTCDPSGQCRIACEDGFACDSNFECDPESGCKRMICADHQDCDCGTCIKIFSDSVSGSCYDQPGQCKEQNG